MKRLRKFIEFTAQDSPVILAQIVSLLMIAQLLGWFWIVGSSLSILPGQSLYGITVISIGVAAFIAAVPALIDILVNKTIFGSADRVL